MTADVIPLRPRESAPVVTLPRSEFGQRKAGLDAARAADERQAARIRSLAAEARNALDGWHVCPSLVHALAARVEGLAHSASALADEAKSLGLLKAVVQLREHANLLETLAAETEAERA